MRHCIGIYLTISAAFSLMSCDTVWKSGPDTFEPHLVVEGWVYDGDYPKVIVSQVMNFDSNNPEAGLPLKDIPVRWAKVTVSDGTNEEVLVGRVDNNYYPPFIYSGSEIMGTCGKTYTLKVEYSGETVTGNTYIPENVSIDDISYTESPECDTLFSVSISFRDSPGNGDKYKVFVRALPDEKRFYSAFLGTFGDDTIGPDGAGRVTVYRAYRNISDSDYTPYFKPGETVEVMLTKLPEDGFDFWVDYENEVTNGKNPMFPSTSDLRSNVTGGSGIWCGYGTDTRAITIPRQ